MILIFLMFSQIEATANLSKNFVNKKLTVGDQFEIIAELTSPAGKKFSEPFVDLLEPFVIINQEHKSIQEKGHLRTIYILKVAPFNVGDMRFPPIKFILKDSTGIDTIKTNEVPVKVNSVLPEGMKDINDIKEAIEFPNPLPLIIFIIVIGVGILGFIGFKLYKRYERVRLETKPSVPCWEEAIEAINNLLKQELISAGLLKKFYYSLSEILKRYLEYRFGFPAIEQTTTEIIYSMKKEKISLREGFGEFFARADLVKYAKYIPPQADIEAIIYQAKDLITKTIPKEEPMEHK